MTDRLREAFESLSVDAVATAECPSSDRLWDGAHGALPPDELENLLTHVAACGACAEAWRVARDFDREFAAAPVRATIPGWWYPLAAALVMAVGSSLLLISPSAPPAPPVNAVNTTTRSVPAFLVTIEKAPIRVSPRYALTWRGPGDGKKFLQELADALEPYRRDDYRGSVGPLGALVSSYPDASEPAFYLGVSLLQTDQAAAAVAPLIKARDTADADQRDEARWFLAAAYERSGQPAAARAELQAVCDGKGTRSSAACTAIAAR